MKTKTRKPKTNKAQTIRRAHRATSKQKLSSTLVRDLMLPIYVFGRHAPEENWIVERQAACSKIAARENFYLRAGNQVYFANTTAYAASAIAPERIIERIDALFA